MPELNWSFVQVSDDETAETTDDDGVLERLRAAIAPPQREVGDVVSRVFVLGTFGTDAVADRLASVLRRRGRETHAVTTDDRSGDRRPRGRSAPIETVVVEGGDAETPIRDARDLLGPPDVVVVTAVGRGDLAALGPGRGDVVRSIAGAVPAGAHVVNAEGSPAVSSYLEIAIERRGASLVHVGDHDADAPGAELTGAIDGALASLDEAPLPREERDALVATSRPEWVDLPEGRLFDGLGVTDAVAVERLRRALADDAAVELVVVLPRDRRDVAAAFASYAERSHRRTVLGRVHAVGPLASRFDRRCDAPTVVHEPNASADDVLETALSSGPTMVVGSQDCLDGSGLSEAMRQRIERSGTPRIG